MTRRVHWLVAMLFAGLTTSTSAAAAAPAPVAPSAPASGHDARDDAYVLHAAEVAEVLARSANPRHLIVAAKLGHGAVADALQRRVSPDAIATLAARPAPPDADELVGEALRLGAADPLLWWIAATDCPAMPTTCDAPGAIARLRELAPSNGAVWTLGPAPRATAGRAGKDAAAPNDADGDEILKRIAAASRHDHYLSERIRAYLDAFEQLPLPADVVPDPSDFTEPPSDDLVRDLLAFGLALADALPGLQFFTPLCGQETLARLGAPREAACRDALQNMLRTADTVVVHQLASNALLRMLPPGAERNAVGRARERLEWQIHASGALLSPPDGKATVTDTAAVEELLALWRAPGATELGVMRQQLEAAGVALDPPPDWRGWRSIDVVPAAAGD